MATTRPQRREEFNRAREFIAARVFTMSGVDHQPGDPIDKTLATTRTLRQLYDLRRIDMLPPEAVSKEPPKPKIPNFDEWDEEQLTDWLTAHSRIPKFGTPKDQLVFKAIDVWEAQYGGDNGGNTA